MKHTLTAALAAIVGLACASANPEKEEGKKHRGHPGIKQLIEKFDKDGNGEISESEREAIREHFRNGGGPPGRGGADGGTRGSRNSGGGGQAPR